MRSVRLRLSLLLTGAAALLAACANSDPAGCKVGADCASGVCNADGTCEPASTTNSGGAGGEGGEGGSGAAGGQGGSGAAGGQGGQGGSGGSGVCLPNNDGTLTAAELPFAAGITATFRVATNATFDTAGTMAAGTRTWDFTPMFSGDKSVLVETASPAGAWWVGDFAGATYATRLSDSADLLGVFEVKAEGLFLRGVVSPEDGFTATKLTYDPPVQVLAFPMKKGDTWKTTSTVSGLASGVAAYYFETYDSKVDADGVAKTPYADFAVLRVGTDLTRTVGALITTTRTYSFATECFGTVATVVSQTNELSVEFTKTSELRRLTP